MEESAFNVLAEAELARIESALEGCGVDIDIEPKPGGILELEFDNGTKMIINRHTAAREIWVAAKSGGFHFRPQDGKWVNTRGGADLWDMLAALAGEQAGVAIRLTRPA
ncbi:iron donor protein CyaY [Thauera sp.]|jgi:CyaY protein|uniref:iron donor protein CyaY n=1 Tax=Thauera sp. TaxID=1905334 RepID=UPI002A360037|nr:iron donor protein CyaY [Thauera sp.]MDX9884240.1 iron donor protein CyaY [Thauera sp.]